MPENQNREVVRFIRIRANPFYLAGISSNNKVNGYLNLMNEYQRWDLDYTELTPAQIAQFTINGVPSPSPFNFFQPSTYPEYKETVFVLDGIYERYDRAVHNLEALGSKLYLQETTGDMRSWRDSRIVKSFGSSTLDQVSRKSLTFRINPTNIQVQKKKLFKKLRTRGGWAFQHWGPEIGVISLQGTTGNLIPDFTQLQKTKKVGDSNQRVLNELGVDERPTETNSPAMKAFKELERWYDTDQNEQSINNGYLTAIQYRDRIYVGHIQDFQFTEKGSEPFQIFYKLKFLVHYDASNLQAATTHMSNQIVRNEETLAFISELKAES